MAATAAAVQRRSSTRPSRWPSRAQRRSFGSTKSKCARCSCRSGQCCAHVNAQKSKAELREHGLTPEESALMQKFNYMLFGSLVAGSLGSTLVFRKCALIDAS